MHVHSHIRVFACLSLLTACGSPRGEVIGTTSKGDIELATSAETYFYDDDQGFELRMIFQDGSDGVQQEITLFREAGIPEVGNYVVGIAQQDMSHDLPAETIWGMYDYTDEEAMMEEGGNAIFDRLPSMEGTVDITAIGNEIQGNFLIMFGGPRVVYPAAEGKDSAASESSDVCGEVSGQFVAPILSKRID